MDIPYEKIALLAERNSSDLLSGDFTIKTGVDDIGSLGKISKFNNLQEFPFYTAKPCNTLKGSPGEFHPPNVNTKEPLNLFIPAICRSIEYEYEKDDEVKGIKGNRFSLSKKTLDNGTVYEENKCYQSGEKLPSGLSNASVCNYGFPAFISAPHFYMADPSLLDAVEGITPSVKDMHESYVTLEPVSFSET